MKRAEKLAVMVEAMRAAHFDEWPPGPVSIEDLAEAALDALLAAERGSDEDQG